MLTSISPRPTRAHRWAKMRQNVKRAGSPPSRARLTPSPSSRPQLRGRTSSHPLLAGSTTCRAERAALERTAPPRQAPLVRARVPYRARGAGWGWRGTRDGPRGGSPSRGLAVVGACRRVRRRASAAIHGRLIDSTLRRLQRVLSAGLGRPVHRTRGGSKPRPRTTRSRPENGSPAGMAAAAVPKGPRF